MDVKFFDSLYEGDSPNGVKLGMGLTGGDFWPRVDGCSMLYRGTSMERVDFESILTVTDLGVVQIACPSYVSHDNDTIYYYVIRRANGCGCNEHTLGGSAKVAIDADGDLREICPNGIGDVRVKKVGSDRVEFVWRYVSVEHESEPVYFKIYTNNGVGGIDYENPVESIDYLGRRFYRYACDSLAVGEYLFAIRAVDAEGRECRSLVQLKVEISEINPVGVTILDLDTV